MKVNFTLGAARVSLFTATPERTFEVRVGYVRVNGWYLDFWRLAVGPLHIGLMRPREQDGHHIGATLVDRLDFHNGYRGDDRAANPRLPTYGRNY